MKVTRVLILEDDPRRISKFNQLYIGCTVISVDNVDDFIAAAFDEKWDIVHLDHDLDGRHFVPSYEFNTGTTAANFLVSRDLSSIPKFTPIIIHTHNRAMGERMFKSLKTAGYNAIYAPFWKLDPTMPLYNTNSSDFIADETFQHTIARTMKEKIRSGKVGVEELCDYIDWLTDRASSSLEALKNMIKQ